MLKLRSLGACGSTRCPPTMTTATAKRIAAAKWAHGEDSGVVTEEDEKRHA